MISLTFALPASDLESIETLLFSMGATAVTLEDAADAPQLEPKPGEILLWPDSKLTAWFEEQSVLNQSLKALKGHFPDLNYQIENVKELDWQHHLHAGFKRLNFGQRLCISPSWDMEKPSERTTLILDPGLAFGTGTHPTTSMCLTWLSNHIESGQTLLDYGCGSGILALAALKLGASHAWAIDYDPQAIISTQANAEKNDISALQMTTGQPEELASDLKVDVIIANILAGPLLELAETFKQHAHQGTQLVLSGLLIHQVKEIEHTYSPWFEFIERHQEDDWVCLSANFKL